jgi:hypothetical protein
MFEGPSFVLDEAKTKKEEKKARFTDGHGKAPCSNRKHFIEILLIHRERRTKITILMK